MAVFPTGWARLLKTPGAQGLGLQRSKNPGRCTTRLWLVRGRRVRLGRPWRNGTTALGGGAWFDFNADAVRRDGRPSMRTLFDRFCEVGHRQVPTIVRAGSPGLFARADRRCLARASFSFLQPRPRLFIRRLAPAFGRFEHRPGFAARRAGVDVTPFRNFEAIPRECQRRSKISPPGRSKTSPLNVMRYAVLGGSCGPTGSTLSSVVKQAYLGISAVFGFG